ncbi:MAG: Rrf2 family transcriptional regulator [Pseudomonadota bacterium]
MQITKFSDYGLRILLHLAAAGDEQISARDIAEAQNISFNHLAKVAQWLASEGYVRSTRGRGGGMRLNIEPERISIGQLLRKSEAGSPLVECMRADGGACCLKPSCGLIPILAEAQEAFFAVLDQRMLADVLQRRDGMLDLIRSLHVPAA